MSVSSFCDSVEMKIDLFDYTQSKATYQLKVIRENPYKIITTLTPSKEVFLNLTYNFTYSFFVSIY